MPFAKDFHQARTPDTQDDGGVTHYQQSCSNMRTILLAYLVISITTTSAFAPPAFGLGALFRPPNIKIIKSDGDGGKLEEAGTFFVDAFWTGKVGGGADTLSPKQAFQLERQQVAEFNKRYKRRGAVQSGRLPGNYAGRSLDSSSELVLCVNGSGEVIGCAGIEGKERNRRCCIVMSCLETLIYYVLIHILCLELQLQN